MKLKSWYVISIPLLYALVGSAWILISDSLLPIIASDPFALTQLQTYKGWGYVLATALTLYALLRRYDHAARQALDGERAARMEAQDSGERYRNIIETAEEGIWTIDDRERTTFVNQKMADMLGFSVAEMLAQPLQAYMDEEGQVIIAHNLERRRLGLHEQYDFCFVRKDGTRLWALVSSCPQYDAGGQYSGALAMVTDITQRKAAEEALQESEERFRSLFSHNPHPMWVYELATLRFLEVNDVAMAKYGYSRDEFLSMRLTDIRPAEDIPALMGMVSPDRPKVQFSGQWRHLLKNGRIIYVEITSHRFEYDGKQAVLVVAQDVTQRHEVEVENVRAKAEIERSHQELALAYEATIVGWSRALDLRDKETEGHTQRVTDLSQQLARLMGVSEPDLLHMRRGALLHDIGKMGVPDGILHKPGPLTDEEWALMRRHPELAYEMLAPIEYLRPALDIPYCHHERWDGGGYPRRLAGEDIPLAARIFSVVDVWDALTSDRPYRPAWTTARAWGYIQEHADLAFDAQVVRVFERIVRV